MSSEPKPLFPAIAAEEPLYHYEYPMPSVVVDIVVTCCDQKLLLLVERKNDPWKGCKALPGGFVNMDERIINAAGRELQEETGLVGRTLRFVNVFDNPDRDPRGRVISHAYHLDCGGMIPDVKGADDVENARWFDKIEYIKACRKDKWGNKGLAADHGIIIQQAIHW